MPIIIIREMSKRSASKDEPSRSERELKRGKIVTDDNHFKTVDESIARFRKFLDNYMKKVDSRNTEANKLQDEISIRFNRLQDQIERMRTRSRNNGNSEDNTQTSTPTTQSHEMGETIKGIGELKDLILQSVQGNMSSDYGATKQKVTVKDHTIREKATINCRLDDASERIMTLQSSLEERDVEIARLKELLAKHTGHSKEQDLATKVQLEGVHDALTNRIDALQEQLVKALQAKDSNGPYKERDLLAYVGRYLEQVKEITQTRRPRKNDLELVLQKEREQQLLSERDKLISDQRVEIARLKEMLTKYTGNSEQQPSSSIAFD
ncbi:hypothetical protein PRIPAC_96062 [Pristionchus pacificus]|uniref:Uncharacterized protein n=1 Tax=Pristionchus pacificus TaxID=54126 RepID=A0A2A6CH56_PRIPA|nr:hypothetical protein PRIPAC_96062 [Pristionchus pacificus]|eukprot:PDM77408.1 hypothetical protein PRIPAC_33138 [Pristionchus pacificus]